MIKVPNIASNQPKSPKANVLAYLYKNGSDSIVIGDFIAKFYCRFSDFTFRQRP